MDDSSLGEHLDLEKIIAESDQLPTMPGVARQLLSISEWDKADLGRVADIISKDVSLSSMDHVDVAKVLFEMWGLPTSLRIPVLYHHAPEKARGMDPRTIVSIRVQYVAGLVGEWLYASGKKNAIWANLKHVAGRELRISSQELEALMLRVDKGLLEISALNDSLRNL